MLKHLPLAALTLAASLAAGACSAAPLTAAAAAPHPGLPNFGVVAPGLYRGAAPTAAGLASLKAMGVQRVVDLRISPREVKAESREVEALGMTFVNLPMGSDPPTVKERQSFLQLAGQAALHPVYVHCQYGADRTGTMVGVYRRVDDGWTFPRTYAEMRHYGFKPWLTQLSGYVQRSSAK